MLHTGAISTITLSEGRAEAKGRTFNLRWRFIAVLRMTNVQISPLLSIEAVVQFVAGANHSGGAERVALAALLLAIGGILFVKGRLVA